MPNALSILCTLRDTLRHRLWIATLEYDNPASPYEVASNIAVGMCFRYNHGREVIVIENIDTLNTTKLYSPKFNNTQIPDYSRIT